MSSISNNLKIAAAGIGLILFDQLLFKLLGISIFDIKNINNINKPNNKRISKFENNVGTILHEITKKEFVSIRPSWLKNPKTGRNLELDLYNEQLKLAVEVQGRQHYVYTPYYHKSYQDFKDQQERDRLKNELCRKRGIRLIYVPYTISNNNYKIKQLLKKEINK